MSERTEFIHSKGFDIGGTTEYLNAANEYKRIKVGVKNLEDATLELGSLKQAIPRHPFTQKPVIYKAIMENDYSTMRAISNFFYKTSGIYQRVCNYFAFLYRYDWYVVPEVYDKAIKEEKILQDFSKVLGYLDGSQIKKVCGDIALTVITEGCYYGYITDDTSGIVLQQLPNDYCRSYYSVQGMPAVEFNMKFFDTFKDAEYRMRVLNLFPDDFKKGYMLFKAGKLPATSQGDTGGWYLLEPSRSVKFNVNHMDMPLFLNSIPAILDLDAAQDLDRRKQMQQLLKIIVQKLPLDKNGDLIFDIDEARDLHNNAVEMLKRAIGVDVLTTFADIDSIDMSDDSTTAASDELQRVERTVYNSLGTSQNLFNSDGSLATTNSILNDESSMRNLLLQFSNFFNRISTGYVGKKNKYQFKFYMLETTQYNYQNLSKLYKEQTQIGYSKMLPQIALGHSQSFILNSVHFENEVLHLSEIMIPPLMSSTLNGEDILGKSGQSNSDNNQKSTEKKTVKTSDNKGGRPEKAENEKSDKTLANQESMK